jgi:hypothetical protein
MTTTETTIYDTAAIIAAGRLAIAEALAADVGEDDKSYDDGYVTMKFPGMSRDAIPQIGNALYRYGKEAARISIQSGTSNTPSIHLSFYGHRRTRMAEAAYQKLKEFDLDVSLHKFRHETEASRRRFAEWREQEQRRVAAVGSKRVGKPSR